MIGAKTSGRKKLGVAAATVVRMYDDERKKNSKVGDGLFILVGTVVFCQWKPGQ